MEKISGITYQIVCLVVIVIVVATLVIPTVDSLDETLIVDSQNTDYHFKMVSDASASSAEYTITATINEETGVMEYYVNDYLLPYQAGWFEIAISDTFIIQHTTGSSGPIRIHDLTQSVYYNHIASAVIDDGTLTFTNDQSEELEITFSWLCIADKNGNYGAFEAGHSFKFNADSKLYLMETNWTVTNSELVPSSFEVKSTLGGTYESLSSIGIAMPNVQGLTEIELTASLNNVVYNEDLSYTYTLEGSATATCITNLGTYTNESGPVYRIFAPIQYYHTDSGLISILSIIPLLLLVVPVLYAARMITRRD